MLKILIYTHAFAPSVGGVETYVMRLARGLAERSDHGAGSNLKVTVATHTPAGRMVDATLPFRVVRQPGLVRLFKLLWQTDIVHLAGPTFLPMLCGLLLRRPVVVEHSGYQAGCPNGLLLDERTKTVCPGHFMARRYRECVRCNAANVGLRKSLAMLLLTFPRRWLCARVAKNVGPSNHVGRRVALPRTVTIHHGVPEATKPESRDVTTPVCFAYIGRLVWEKGVSVLLAAAGELTARGYDFRLRIIGDGPERSRLEQMTDGYGLRSRTVFAGYLQGDALAEALRDVSVTAIPSVWEDVAPVAAIEHMMQGRLLIASDIGGLGEIVGEAGLKFSARDAEGLASCLQRVLDEPDLPKVLGEKARQRALQFFREERMVAEHLFLYRDVAGRSGEPSNPRARNDE
ncbi:MAG: glycosyltransferase family 4 protein [Terriglobia bacterium]